MNDKIKVLLADDHPVFLDGVSFIIDQLDQVEIVGKVKDGLEVLDFLKVNECDVLLTDLNMPNLDGEGLVKELKRLGIKTKIIVFSMNNRGVIVSKLLKLGVDGYLFKDSDKSILLEALTTVHRGEKYIPEGVKTAIIENLVDPSRDIKETEIGEDLNDREIEILKLIAYEFTQEEIAEKLFISPHTVSFHKRKLLLKLDVKNSPGLVRKAAELGLLRKE